MIFRAFNPSKLSQFSKLTIFVNLAQTYTNMILTKVLIYTHLIYLGSSRHVPKLLFISNRVVYINASNALKKIVLFYICVSITLTIIQFKYIFFCFLSISTKCVDNFM